MCVCLICECLIFGCVRAVYVGVYMQDVYSLCTCKGQRGNKASRSVTFLLILEVGLQLANPNYHTISAQTILGVQLHVATPVFLHRCLGFELRFTFCAANACARVKSHVPRECF